MDFYHTFKRLIGLKNPRLKLMMLAAARLCGMRYYGGSCKTRLKC